METKNGLRTWSRITLVVDVAHDADLDTLEECLALEVETLVERTAGVGLMGLTTDAMVVQAGT